MARFILVGLVEPQSEAQQQDFDDWYLGNHIEDTALCPNFLSGSVYKLTGKHVGIPSPSEYICIYEVDAESSEEAERALNEYQRDPDAWPGREPGNGSLKVLGSGWYEFERAYHTRG
tara:strand:+ start:200 stop:550 length:351 start_codon:yes stop_codon:yes gene_type:complete